MSSRAPGRPAVAGPVTIASVCAFAMIATQVAGKAARDSLFLTNFPVSALPMMLIASAALSIVAALAAARVITVFGPVRTVPSFFLASGLLVLAEWWYAARNPGPGAVVVYLHIASIGSILISGFWSLVDEAFDPRTAKRGIGRIIGGATIGGLFGGLVAERVGAQAGILWILPVVAFLNIVCALLLPRFAHDGGGPPGGSFAILFARRGGHSDESGFRVLGRTRYLRHLALIVLLGNVAATLIDYVFKAHATIAFPDDANLVRFFALFYTAVSVLTLAVQTGMTRRLLEGIGIANTVSIRPALVTAGGLVTLPALGLLAVGTLRALEMVVQSSLFRSGYELLFTPVVPGDKRRTKTIVDVGADRMGDIVGGALIRLMILLPVAVAEHALVGAAIAISLLSLAIARALHRGYVQALEKSLLHRADALDIDPSARATMMESFTGIDFSLTGAGIRVEELRELAGTRTKEPAPDADEDTVPTAPLSPINDPDIASLLELRSGNPRRVHAELNRARTIGSMVAAQVTTLLAWDEVSGWAARTLAKAAPSITGQLVDRLLDPNEDFAIRRRIPRILSACATRRSVDGLVAALSDARFEVRYQAALALLKIQERAPALGVDSALVYAAVLRETRVDRRLWTEQRLIDEPDAGEDPAIIDPSLRGRAGRRMEHVFTILSLVLPRAPLQVAFKGLLTSDAILRGTGLEYLESVLPREVWSSLHPLLDDTPGTPAPAPPPVRAPDEALEKLMRSSESIELNLQEIRRLARNE
ncbi:MAG TPA: hypothetical protein VF247_05780 [Candidatus Krumholzibacteria bacterium]